jgi:hypothetical protein
MVLSEMSPLLLMLWWKRHPKGQEQVMLGFALSENSADSAKPLAPK